MEGGLKKNLKIEGESDPSTNYDHVKEHKSTQKTSAPHFTSNETFILMSRPLKV